MPLVPPFHSSKPADPRAQGLLAIGMFASQVYHNNSLCTEGNNIEAHYWRSGTGNLRLCQRCAELNQQGR